MKVYKKHFDRAVKQPWCSLTCLVAQALMEERDVHELYYPPSIAAGELMAIFDKHFHRPEDASKKELQELRASLPVEI